MDKLQLEVGWDVDNASLKAGIDQSKKTIEGVGQSVQAVDAKVTQNLSKLNQQLNQSKGNFNGLQHSINQIGRELPAFTYSVQTGFMAISNNLPIFFDEISKIRKENELLNASGQKGVPIWKQLAGGLLSWQTAMVVGITLLTVYGKEIGEWVKGLFGAKKQLNEVVESQNSLNEAFKDNAYKNAIVDIKKLEVGLDLVKKGFISKKAVVEEYNRTIGKTTGEVKTLDQVEQFLVKNADNYVKMTLYKAAANLALEEAAKKAMEAEQSRMKELSEFENRVTEAMPGARTEAQWKQQQAIINKQREERKQAEIKSAEDSQKAQEGIANKFMKRSQEFASKMGIAVLGDGPGKPKDLAALAKAYDEILKISAEGLEKIKALDNEYSIIELSDYDKEKEVLKQKFAEFRKIIEEENKKITEYNKKNKRNVSLIDTSLIASIEEKAGVQLAYKQDTARLQKQYEEEYKVFVEYQKLKEETNSKYADQRFASDLEKIKSFEARLQSEIKAIDPSTSNALEKKRLDDLLKIQEDNVTRRKDAEDKMMVEMLKAYLSYNQKREKIIKDAEDKITEYTKKGLSEQADEVRKDRDKQLEELTRTEIAEHEAFKNVENNLDKMGFNMSLKAIKIGRETVNKLIDGSKLTASQKAKLQKEFAVYFDGLENGIKSQNYEHITSLIQGFDQLVNMATQFDGTMGTALKTIGGMVTQVASLTKTIADGISGAGKGLASSGSGFAAIAGAILSVVGSVMSIIDKKNQEDLQKRAKDREYETNFQLKQISAVTRALEYQLSIIKEIYGVDRVIEYASIVKDTTEEINKGIKSLEVNAGRGNVKNRFLLTGNAEIDALIAEFNNYVTDRTGRFNTRTGLDDKAQSLYDKIIGHRGIQELKLGFTNVQEITRDHVAYLTGLLSDDKLDTASKALIENILNSYKLYKDAVNQLREEMTGTSFSSLLNDVKALFANNGEDSAEAWAKGFDKIMETYIMQRFSREYLEETLQGWYELFDQFAKDGIDSGEKKLLQEAFNKIKEEGDKRIKDIQDAMGYTPSSSSSSDNGISGRINRTVSEDTASAILGFERARYDIAKQTLIISQKSIDFWTTSRDHFIQLLKHQAAIEQNTANTVEKLDEAVTQLKSINSNTGVKVGR